MKKFIITLIATTVSTGIYAATISGHGYTILEHKVSNYDDAGSISVPEPTEKKSLMMGVNSAEAHNVTTKVNVRTKVYADHEVSIQNLTGRTQVYKYGYWLKVINKLYRVDDKVQLIHGGVLMSTDQSHMENLIFPRVGEYPIQACTYSSADQTACSNAKVGAIA